MHHKKTTNKDRTDPGAVPFRFLPPSVPPHPLPKFRRERHQTTHQTFLEEEELGKERMRTRKMNAVAGVAAAAEWWAG